MSQVFRKKLHVGLTMSIMDVPEICLEAACCPPAPLAFNEIYNNCSSIRTSACLKCKSTLVCDMLQLNRTMMDYFSGLSLSSSRALRMLQ